MGNIEKEVEAAKNAVEKILEEAEGSKEKEDTINGDVPDADRTESEEKPQELENKLSDEVKSESEDEIPEEIEVEEAATDEEAEKSEGQKNFDRMMKEVDNQEEEEAAAESDEVMEVEV